MNDKIYIAVKAKDTSRNLLTTLAFTCIKRSDLNQLSDIKHIVTNNNLTKASFDFVRFTYIDEKKLSKRQAEQVKQIKARIKNDYRDYITCLKIEEFKALNGMPFVRTLALERLTNVYADNFKGSAWCKDLNHTMICTREITFSRLERAFN